MKTKFIIDAHAHTGYWPNLKECEDDLVISDKKHNINFCLFSFDGSEFNENTDHRVRLVMQIIGFEKAYDFISRYPNKFGMLCWIRPHTENNIKEVENFIVNHRSSVYGLKIHPFASQLKINDPIFIPYFKLAEKYSLPILVHTATDKYSKVKYLAEVCKAWPHLNFIAAHGELYSNHKSCMKAMLECSNLYIDTAWFDISGINVFINNGLSDRIIFGTDNPIDGVKTLDNKLYLNYFSNSISMSQQDFDKIMYKNAIKVYQINPKILKN